MRLYKRRALACCIAFNLLFSLVPAPAFAVPASGGSPAKAAPKAAEAKAAESPPPVDSLIDEPLPVAVPGQVIVKFKKNSKAADISASLDEVDGKKKGRLKEIGVDVVQIPAGMSPEAAAEQLETRKDVEYAEPNGIVNVLSTTPNDPYFGSSGTWGQSYQDMFGLQKIAAPEAWDLTVGDPEIVVAVSDTGLDFSHPDIQGNIWSNEDEIAGNGVDDDSNGYVDDTRGWDYVANDNNPTDDHGHGTHCSGTIAAATDNGIGIAGVSWNAKIMPVKFLNSGGGGTEAAGASSIIYAANNGADVVSCSWGGSGLSATIQAAVDYAVSKGTVVVAAAGNNSTVSTNYSPAGLNNVLTVAATDANDTKASFSNYGTVVEVAAPGVDILSLRAAGTALGSGFVGTQYSRLSGTSMACPHVSGVVALMLSLDSELTPARVSEILVQTSDPVSALNGVCVANGRVNAAKALALTNPAPRITQTVPADDAIEVPVDNGLSMTFSKDVTPDAAFGDIVLSDGVSSVEASCGMTDNVITIDPLSDLVIDKAYTVTVPAAAVKDADGRNMRAEFTFGFRTQDTIDPGVASTDPSEDAIDVALNKTIKMTFDEPIVAGANFGDVSLTGAGVEWPFTTSISRNVLSIDPSQDMVNDAVYTVSIPAGALKDRLGHSLPGSYSFAFHTVPDRVAPTPVASNPSDNKVNVLTAKTMGVTFSENVAPGTAISGVTLSDGTSVVPIECTVTSNVLKIDPESDLEHGKNFVVTVPAGAVEDPAGNAMATGYSFGFSTPDGSPPTIASSVPAAGASGVAANGSIEVTFDEPISLGLNGNRIILKNGPLTVAATVSVSQSKLTVDPAADFTYNTDYQLVIPPEAVVDASGNGFADSYSLTFKSIPDMIPPTVTAADPAASSANVSLDKTIVVTLSERCLAGGNFAQIALKDGATTVDANVTISGRTLTVDPLGSLSGRKVYTLTIPAGAIKDTADNPIAVWSMTFDTDVTAPTVSSADPAADARQIAANKTITVAFNENIAAGASFAQVALKDGATTVVSTASISGKVLTIDPVSDLAGDKYYTVSVPGGAVTDVVGNPLAAAYSSGFYTVDTIGPAASSATPALSSTDVAVSQGYWNVNFNETPAAGPNFSGITVKCNGAPVAVAPAIVSGWFGATYLNVPLPTPLTYNATYTLELPAGALKDAYNNPSAVQTLTFTTVADLVPPAVAAADPVAGAKDVAPSKTVTITFSENVVADAAFGAISLSNAGLPVEANVSLSGKVLTIDPVSDLATRLVYTVSIPAGAIKDTANNPLAPWSSTFDTDVTAPTVSVIDPAASAIQVPVNKTVSLTFSENITASPTFDQVTLKSGTTTVTATASISGKVLTIDPQSDLATDKTYTVSVPAGAVTDSVGIPLAAAYSTSFATIDTIGPAVSSGTPALGASGVAVSQSYWKAYFNEVPAAGPNFSGITVKCNGSPVAVTPSIIAAYWFSPTHLNVPLPTPLSYNATYTLELPAGALKDAYNNPSAAQTLTFTTVVDLVAPTVASADPVAGAKDVAPSKTVTVTFSENVVADAAFSSIGVSNAGLPVEANVSLAGKVLTIDPVSDLATRLVYTVSIPAGAIKDTANNPLAPWSSTFDTDVTAPTVSAIDPAASAIQVPVGKTVSLTFSENVTASPTFDQVALKSGTTTVTATASISGKVLTLDPASDLATDKTYTVSVPAGAVTDVVGIPLAAAYSSNFTTLDTIGPAATSGTPVLNATGVTVSQSYWKAYFNEVPAAGPNFAGITVKCNGSPVAITPTIIAAYWFSPTHLNVPLPTPLTYNATYTMDLPAGALKDAYNNPSAAQTLTFTTVADLVVPTVTAADPVAGAKDVAPNKTITVTFSENAVADAAFSSIGLSNAGLPVEANVSLSGKVLTIDPVSDLATRRVYTVSIPAGAIKDTANNPLAPWSITFDTDVTAPTGASCDPAASAIQVPVNKTVSITFSENIAASPTFDQVALKSGTTTVTVTASISGKVLTIDPQSDLATDKTCTVSVPAGAVTDTVGNPIAAAYATNFTTLDTIGPAASSGVPALSATGVAISQSYWRVNFNEVPAAGANFSGISVKCNGVPLAVTPAITTVSWWGTPMTYLNVPLPTPLTYNATYTMDLPAGALKDSYNNPSPAQTVTFTTVADLVVPTAASADPVAGAKDVAPSKTITVTFSENVVADAAFSAISLSNAGLPVEANVSLSGKVLTIDPVSDLATRLVYTVSIPAGAIKDTANNPLAPWSITFDTDVTAPTVASCDPAASAIQVPVAKTVAITFSENIAASPTFDQVALKDGSTTVTSTVSLSGKVLTIDPAGDLSTDKTYTVSVPAGAVTDIVGNPFAAAYTPTFTTLDTIGPAASSGTPVLNSTGVAVSQSYWRIYFNEVPAAGPNFSGISVKCNGVPLAVTPAVTTTTMWGYTTTYLNVPLPTPLTYNATYTMDLPQGALKDSYNNPSPAQTLTFSTVAQ